VYIPGFVGNLNVLTDSARQRFSAGSLTYHAAQTSTFRGPLTEKVLSAGLSPVENRGLDEVNHFALFVAKNRGLTESPARHCSHPTAHDLALIRERNQAPRVVHLVPDRALGGGHSDGIGPALWKPD
jgi:hypothetical protein